MYNVRVYNYVNGQQVRIYRDIVEDGRQKELIMDYGLIENPFNFFEGSLELMKKSRMKILKDSSDVDESMRISMSRTKNNIYYIARSNIWDYFLTLTIDPSKKERYDFKETSSWVRKWFNNIKNRKAPDLYYLIVPEEHENGGWHFHALIGGTDGLTFKRSGRYTKDGEVIYNLDDWRYGWTTATKVRDSGRASSYLTKYVTKTLCAMTKGLQRYWVSNNCKRADVDEYLLNPEQMKVLVNECYEKMTWKKGVRGYYQDIDYFEIPYQEEQEQQR